MRALVPAIVLIPLLLGTTPLSGRTAPEKKPQHVSDAVRKAWDKRTLVGGWVRFTETGFMQFHAFEEGKAGDLPVFLVLTPIPGVFRELPPPDRDFGILVYPGPGKPWKLGAPDLKALAGMKRLVMLTLNNTRVTDDGLKELAAATNLRQLYLVKAGLTDAAARELAALHGLHTLSLNDNAELTSACLKGLGGLKQLRWLSLGNTRVTGLKDLAALEQLETLFLPGTGVTDASLDDVAGFKKLKALFLSGTKVTDAGMRSLSRLRQLRTLHLNSTAITDEGLRELADLRQLRKLPVRDTKVTDAGIEKLQKALPELKVER